MGAAGNQSGGPFACPGRGIDWQNSENLPPPKKARRRKASDGGHGTKEGGPLPERHVGFDHGSTSSAASLSPLVPLHPSAKEGNLADPTGNRIGASNLEIRPHVAGLVFRDFQQAIGEFSEADHDFLIRSRGVQKARPQDQQTALNEGIGNVFHSGEIVTNWGEFVTTSFKPEHANFACSLRPDNALGTVSEGAFLSCLEYR